MDSTDLSSTNAATVTSDKRYKTDIATLQAALDTVKQLRGVTYSWRRDEFPAKGFSTGVHSGFIAQEVEQVIPEAVATAADGFKSLRMSYVIPYLVEAAKAQDATIKALEEKLAAQEAKLAAQDAENAEQNAKLAAQDAAAALEAEKTKALEEKSRASKLLSRASFRRCRISQHHHQQQQQQ
jgi:regulator of protease activity HflC (stomatin/prohibitin superfamily)